MTSTRRCRTLSFSTARPGHVKVTLYDLSGRLVRTLLDQTTLPAGYHDLMVDGRTASGGRLASGVYFYRIESAEGESAGRFVIAK
jgi:flagellar hook assembly protein FlgD